jgi:hypothetical protein
VRFRDVFCVGCGKELRGSLLAPCFVRKPASDQRSYAGELQSSGYVRVVKRDRSHLAGTMFIVSLITSEMSDWMIVGAASCLVFCLASPPAEPQTSWRHLVKAHAVHDSL